MRVWWLKLEILQANKANEILKNKQTGLNPKKLVLLSSCFPPWAQRKMVEKYTINVNFISLWSNLYKIYYFL